jgi:hypothetical protein
VASDETHRWVRTDMSSVSNADAKQHLAEFHEIVRVEAALGHPNEREDLVALGNIAVIEGIISWDNQRDGTRCSRKRWIRQVVRWRLREYMMRNATRCAQTIPLQEAFELGPERTGTGHNRPWEEILPDVEAVDPESAVVEQGSFQKVLGHLARLPQHDQLLLDGELRGESIATVAKTLGITKQRASVVRVRAVSRLRARCATDR